MSFWNVERIYVVSEPLGDSNNRQHTPPAASQSYTEIRKYPKGRKKEISKSILIQFSLLYPKKPVFIGSNGSRTYEQHNSWTCHRSRKCLSQ